jgi:miniconductance mechanosensitive channel
MLEFFKEYGLSENAAAIVGAAVRMFGVLLLSIVAHYIARRFILRAFHNVIRRTKTDWDDVLLKNKVLNHVAHLVPAIIIYVMAPVALAGFEQAADTIRSLTQIYMIVVLLLTANALLSAGLDIYRKFRISREIPIRGFLQVLKIVIFFIGGIYVISTAMGKSPIFLLSGLGAMTAVLLLIFKDAILGLVAGIQLTANKMIAVGDWIEMPKYGADGDVLDLTLTTVKVQNWDKTITTIPTYALISDAFKNWRGMQESGGRRIKRSIAIDMNSIKFCDEEMLERFRKIQYISEHIERKRKELQEHNRLLKVDDSSLANGRRLTNVGTFRAYIQAYLKNHPAIHQNMTFLVRQLAPSDHGLPIEIYVFSSDTAWVTYEAIQADIFDHLLAVLPEFDLRVFQSPAGHDFQQLVSSHSN